MKSPRSKILAGTAIFIVLSLMVTAVVAAQSPEFWPFSSDPETGEESAAPTELVQIGINPDENGYTGAITNGTIDTGDTSGTVELEQNIQQQLQLGLQPDDIDYVGPKWYSQNQQEPSSDSVTPEDFDWESLLQGPQPDSNVDAPADPEWSNFYYIYSAGSTLRPRDSGQDWANSGSGGCIYATTLQGEVMNLHLDIPTGSRIDYLRIFYYDTSASDSQAWVTTYDGASGLTDVASVSSSGTGGYGTSLSNYVGHVVDNVNNSYVLNWRPNVAGSTMMLCGLRVAYRLP